MKQLFLYILSIGFLFTTHSHAQNSTSKADKLLSESLKNDEHALSVLVAKGDKILYHKTVGYSDVDKQIKANNETTFRIGSVSKQFYATAILKLVEQGKLKLDDPLTKFIKDFPGGDAVTIHHLLTHTSGIKSYTDEPDFIYNVITPIVLEDLILKIKTLGYDFDPGEKWKYNNSAYAITGYIVEKVSGMSAEEFLAQQIFKPSGMSHSGVYDNKKEYENEALGYSFEGGDVKLSLNWDMTWAGGAGNLYSTANDLLLWNRQLFGAKVINKESIQKAHTKVTLNQGDIHAYGYGWGLGEYKGLKAIGHSGGLHGFLSNLVYYPEIDATVVVLSNCSPPKKIQPGEFSNELTDIFFEEHLKDISELIENKVEAVGNTQNYDKYLGKYEYPGGAIMTVTKDGDRLMAQLTGQPNFQIFQKSDSVFFWKVVDAEITFHFNENGEVDYGIHKQNGGVVTVPRVTESKEIDLDHAIFKSYAGTYLLNGTEVNVWKEENAFYAQITGQPKFQIYPKSTTRFFLKAVVAEIEFDNSESPAPGFTLFQANMELKAIRK